MTAPDPRAWRVAIAMGRQPPLQSLAEKLESRYIPEPNTGCWLWLGALDYRGYGVVMGGSRSAGGQTYLKAHRASYEHAIGPIPDGMFVCHRCDTPACVNPDHLFIGTHTDNMRDMASKGRGAPRIRTSDAEIRSASPRDRCRRGHIYTPETCYIPPGTRTRVCRLCRSDEQRGRNRNRLATAAAKAMVP